MADRVKLTKKIIDATKRPEEGQVFLRDTELPGFGVRLTRGSTTFILEKKVYGRSRRMKIGPYGPMTLEQARDEARKKIGEIATGLDPAQARIDRSHEPTFKKLIETYKERHLPRKRSAFKDEGNIKNHLEAWNNRRLTAIERKDIALLHSKVGQKNGRYAANRLLALIRKMFNLGKIWGLCEGENPAVGIEMFPETSRDRFIQPHELPKFMEALKAEPNPFVKAAILTLLLSGQRKGEVLSMRWEDVDLEQGTWRIPETKPGRPHYLPLPFPVIEMLKNFPRFEGNPFVFCGRWKGHLVNIDKNFKAIKKASGLSDIRPHDLRRTVGSWLAGSGASLPLIGKVLNHSQPSTTAIYARFNLDPIRAALDANARQMLLTGESEGATK